MPENTEKIQESTKFQKGKSGNPRGRPVGARNKASLLAEELLACDIRSVCQMVVKKAIDGNLHAAKIVIDRLVPPKKDREVNLQLPKIKTTKDVLKAVGNVIKAVASGEISPSEGESLVKILDIHTKAIESYEFEKRLSELEKREGVK